MSTIGRFYDHLGFLSPLIKFKVLFQKLCESKVGWDQTLTGELVQEWKTLITELQENQLISIPQSYLTNVNGEVASYELCGFLQCLSQGICCRRLPCVENRGGNFREICGSRDKGYPTSSTDDTETPIAICTTPFKTDFNCV